MDAIRYISGRMGGLLLSSMLCLGFSASVLAAGFPPSDGPGVIPMRHERFEHPPEVFEVAPPLMRGLRLTEDQLDKMFVVTHEFALAIHERQRLLEKTNKALHELPFADKFDEDKARELAVSAANVMAELNLLHTRREARLFAILSPAQRSIWAEHKSSRDEFAPPSDGGREKPVQK